MPISSYTWILTACSHIDFACINTGWDCGACCVLPGSSWKPTGLSAGNSPIVAVGIVSIDNTLLKLPNSLAGGRKRFSSQNTTHFMLALYSRCVQNADVLKKKQETGGGTICCRHNQLFWFHFHHFTVMSQLFEKCIIKLLLNWKAEKLINTQSTLT